MLQSIPAGYEMRALAPTALGCTGQLEWAGPSLVLCVGVPAMTAKPPESPHPALLAMLICDQAIREGGTNKVSLIGIFDQIFARGFPFEWIRPVALYARLTDAQGQYRMRVELVRIADEQAVGRGDFETPTIADRMRAHEITLEFNRLRFEQPGRYEFRLFANDRYVGGAVLNVVQREEREPPNREVPEHD